MHRQLLLNQLKEYKSSANPSEALLVDQFQHFVESHSACFERSLEIGHLTASCWLWNLNQTKALFMLHKKLKMWLQLGGHADGDSDLLSVALKEAKEESGISKIDVLSPKILDLSIHEIPENAYEKAHLHYDVRFLLQVSTHESLQMNHESDDLRWIAPKDFSSYSFDESILKMHDKLNAKT